jgi:hypothetical protein
MIIESEACVIRRPCDASQTRPEDGVAGPPRRRTSHAHLHKRFCSVGPLASACAYDSEGVVVAADGSLNLASTIMMVPWGQRLLLP